MLVLIGGICVQAIPVALMIASIPLVQNDFLLAAVDIAIIIVAFAIRRDRGDLIFLAFGLIALFISEYVFISTGVETFERRSLLGVMPVWLPILWGYAFVAMRRGIRLLETYLH